MQANKRRLDVAAGSDDKGNFTFYEIIWNSVNAYPPPPPSPPPLLEYCMPPTHPSLEYSEYTA